MAKREVKKPIEKKKEPEMMITDDLSQDEFEFVVQNDEPPSDLQKSK